MSSDRELLELAAKAAGHHIDGYVDDMIVQPGNRAGGLVIRNEFGGDSAWHPGNDDGDALRLAVKLNLLVLPYPEDNAVRIVEFKKHADPVNTIVSWGTPPDAIDATRRAIVRAAAAIGKAMP